MTKVILKDADNTELFSKADSEFEKAEILKRKRTNEGVVELFSLELPIGQDTFLEQYNSLSEGTIVFSDEEAGINKGLEINEVDEYKISTNRSGQLVEVLSFAGQIQ
jgi:hypothetical protein